MIGLRVKSAAPSRIGGARHRRGEILRHREVGKHLLAFRHQHDAAASILLWRPVLYSGAGEADRAFGDPGVIDTEETGDRAQRRGLAGPIGTEKGNNLLFGYGQRNTLYCGDDALVDDFDFLNLKQGGHLRVPASGRFLNGQSKKSFCTRRHMPPTPSGSSIRKRIMTTPNEA